MNQSINPQPPATVKTKRLIYEQRKNKCTIEHLTPDS